MKFKDYIAKRMLGQHLHFESTCPILPLNHNGIIMDYEIIDNEILWKVNVDGKLITIGENHPNMEVTKMI